MIQSLILAFQFLTRLPLNFDVDFNKKNLRRSLIFFPWVGLVIGLLLGGLRILTYGKSATISSYLVLLLWVSVTGAIHLDGVSDTFDGFFANKDKERTLEIMKDSCVGSFGVLALIFLLFGKLIFLQELMENKIYFLSFILGNARLSNAIIIGTFPSARPGGMGDMFQKTRPLPLILGTGIIYLLLVFIIAPKYLIVFLIQFLIVLSISFYSFKKIGGVTGDIYGCNVEISELFGLITMWVMNTWIFI